MFPISIDDTPILAFILGDGHLLLNLVLFDEFNRPVLHIKNNQLYYSTIPWDIQLVGTTLTVREAHKKILVEIIFSPPNKVTITRGRFLRNGVEILVRPENILITNNAFVISGCRAHNTLGGLILGPHDKHMGGFMAVEAIPRYLGDRKDALRFEREYQLDQQATS